VQLREAFVLVRAHVAASLVNASGEFIIDSWSSCVDVGVWGPRRVDYIQLLVSYSQRSDQLTSYLSSVLDVPVSHAFFVQGGAGQLGLRHHMRRLDARHSLESITVSNYLPLVVSLLLFQLYLQGVFFEIDSSELEGYVKNEMALI